MTRPIGSGRGPGVGVGDVMRTHVIAVHPDARLGSTAEIMRLGRLRSLPVTDDSDRLLGEITFGTCCAAIGRAVAEAGDGEALHQALEEILDTPIRAHMTESGDVVGDRLPLRDGVARLLRAHSGHLLVVGSAGRILGVLTERDLLERAIRTPRSPRR